MEIQHKRKPINKKALLRKVGIAALCGLVFGLVASGVIYLVLKNSTDLLASKEESPVIIEMGDSEGTESTEGTTEEETSSGTSAQKLQYDLYTTGSLANKFIVGINETNSENFLDKPGEADYATGAIISITSEYLLILATPDAVTYEDSVDVTFYGGETARGYMVKRDKETGISILKVQLSALTPSTQSSIEIAELGNSRNLNRGRYVIAVGNPTGEAGAVEVGQLTSASSSVSFVDGEFGLLVTDIPTKSFSNGFVIDGNRKILGVITHERDSEDEANNIMAIGITDLGGLIERLCNAEQIPYLGLQVTTVSYINSEIYDLPEGLYVKSVDLNSPAMSAGIKAGDIIYSIGKKSLPNGRTLFETLLDEDLTSDSKVVIHLLRYMKGEYQSMSVSVTLRSR